MNDVTEFTCCRGFLAPVPVAGSKAERSIQILIVPVELGSNHASPAGTAMSNASVRPAAARPMSWSRNWPNS